jgi:site-specific recombinase XerD
MASFDSFDTIDCSDIKTDFIREILLDDLYEYLMYTNSDRDNSANARARKVSSLKSFFNYMSSKAHLLDVNITKELDSPKIPSKLPVFLSLAAYK